MSIILLSYFIFIRAGQSGFKMSIYQYLPSVVTHGGVLHILLNDKLANKGKIINKSFVIFLDNIGNYGCKKIC